LIETAWTEFLTTFNEYICRRLANPAAAKDISRNVIVTLHDQLARIRKVERLETWLCLVIRHILIEYDHVAGNDMPVSPELSEEEINDLQAAFHQIVSCLPKIYRDALLHTAFEGLTQKELAKHCGISLSGAKSRIQRGRKRLKRMLLDGCQMELDRRRNSRSFRLAIPERGFHECPTTLWRGPEDNYSQELSGR
jgi:RNA polymerase sigma-70 factor, ECF subfamily